LSINNFCDAGNGSNKINLSQNGSVNIIKNSSLCRGFCTEESRHLSTPPFNIWPMLEPLMKKWKVSKKDLLLILCVFAITGTTTAYVTKLITGWAGFTESTHWAWKVLLRLAVLIFGYQIILLFVAFLLGQFTFFWRYEKKLLARLGILRKEEPIKSKEKA